MVHSCATGMLGNCDSFHKGPADLRYFKFVCLPWSRRIASRGLDSEILKIEV
jgi:hypothetical protein